MKYLSVCQIAFRRETSHRTGRASRPGIIWTGLSADNRRHLLPRRLRLKKQFPEPRRRRTPLRRLPHALALMPKRTETRLKLRHAAYPGDRSFRLHGYKRTPPRKYYIRGTSAAQLHQRVNKPQPLIPIRIPH